MRLCLIAVFAVTAPSPALAQEIAPDAITVTSARMEQDRSETGQAVSVITAADIEREQAVQLADLIARTPGVSLARNGGLGGTTSLFLRGADSDQVLVLVDGVRVNDPAAPAGAYDFGDLLAALVERVEIVRGSNSVAWGSQAIGGVINITTRSAEDGLAVRASGEYGYADTVNLNAAVLAPIGPASVSVNGSFLRSDGISQFRDGTERDAYHNTTLNARLELPLDDGFSLDLRGTYIDARTDIDGFLAPSFAFGDTSEFQLTEQWITSAGINARLGRLANRVGYSRLEVDRQLRDPGGFFPETFTSEGVTDRFEYQGTWTASGSARLSFGYGHEEPAFQTVSYGIADQARANTDSAYALVQLDPLDELSVTAGIRQDDHSLFGGATSIGANAAYRPTQFLLLRASYGEGFKAPSLYQLFSADYGNRNLLPAKSESYEAGAVLDLAGGAVEFGATWYRRNSDNLIDFVSCFGSTDPQCAAYTFGFYDNVARARAQGIEVEAVLRPTSNLRIAANYTLTDTRNLSAGSANDGNRLARRPVHTGNLMADWTSPAGVSLGASVRFVGSRFDDAANLRRLGAYQLVDLRASLAVSEQVDLYGRVENVFNTSYETVAGYGTYPASVHLGLRARLGQ